MLVPQDEEWLQNRGKVLIGTPSVYEQPTQRSNKNDDKSAVAMLKKNDLHESVWKPVINRDKSHERLGRPDVKRRPSSARQLGCVFHDVRRNLSYGRAQTYRNQSNV